MNRDTIPVYTLAQLHAHPTLLTGQTIHTPGPRAAVYVRLEYAAGRFYLIDRLGIWHRKLSSQRVFLLPCIETLVK